MQNLVVKSTQILRTTCGEASRRPSLVHNIFHIYNSLYLCTTFYQLKKLRSPKTYTYNRQFGSGYRSVCLDHIRDLWRAPHSTRIFSPSREYIRSAIVWQSLIRDFTFIHDARYLCKFWPHNDFSIRDSSVNTQAYASFGLQWIISGNLVVLSYF